jgi:hypothetical protein
MVKTPSSMRTTGVVVGAGVNVDAVLSELQPAAIAINPVAARRAAQRVDE